MILESLADNPAILEVMEEMHKEAWPAYLNEGGDSVKYWQSHANVYDEYQFLMKEADEYIALTGSLPCCWNGEVDDLPAGYDDVVKQALNKQESPNTLCVLSMIVSKEQAGRGISSIGFSKLKEFAKAKGFQHMIIPVRPTLKSQYPLISIEDYMNWTREDGLPFDPWLRIHIKNEATILKISHRSAVVSDTIEQWQQWTNLNFGCSGSYIVKGALSPISIDLEQNLGEYIEPNVWVSYTL